MIEIDGVATIVWVEGGAWRRHEHSESLSRQMDQISAICDRDGHPAPMTG